MKVVMSHMSLMMRVSLKLSRLMMRVSPIMPQLSLPWEPSNTCPKAPHTLSLHSFPDRRQEHVILLLDHWIASAQASRQSSPEREASVHELRVSSHLALERLVNAPSLMDQPPLPQPTMWLERPQKNQSHILW